MVGIDRNPVWPVAQFIGFFLIHPPEKSSKSQSCLNWGSKPGKQLQDGLLLMSQYPKAPQEEYMSQSDEGKDLNIVHFCNLGNQKYCLIVPEISITILDMMDLLPLYTKYLPSSFEL